MIDLALGVGKGIYLFIESFFDLKKNDENLGDILIHYYSNKVL